MSPNNPYFLNIGIQSQPLKNNKKPVNLTNNCPYIKDWGIHGYH